MYKRLWTIAAWIQYTWSNDLQIFQSAGLALLDVELELLMQEATPEQTRRTTVGAKDTMTNELNGKLSPIRTIPIKEMDNYLAVFAKEVRKVDSSRYPAKILGELKEISRFMLT